MTDFTRIEGPRRPSIFNKEWWDFSTLPDEVLDAAAALTVDQMKALSRPGFQVTFYDTLEAFYCAEASEYIEAWLLSTAENPVGICGPIGPTEQLPLVAQMVNAMALNLRDRGCFFWGMDQWTQNGVPVDPDHPLSFLKADRELCFDRIRPELAIPPERLIFPTADLAAYTASFSTYRCAIMQGGQGWTKHWAFNDPFQRLGRYMDHPPTVEEFLALRARVTPLHPLTIQQNAATSGGGLIHRVPKEAATVGPFETWQAGIVSIWQAGMHDNALGMRLSTYMIGNKIVDAAVPMSMLALHPGLVRFNFYRGGIGSCAVEMH